MSTLLIFVRLLFLSTGSMLVAITALAVLSCNIDGTIIDERTYFQLSMFWFAISVFFSVITRKGRVVFKFTVLDWLISFVMMIMLITYPHDLDPNPDKFAVIALLLALWFLLRIMLYNYSVFVSFFLSIFIFVGLVEAVLGLSQLLRQQQPYGIDTMTGSFISSEFYAIYLAILLPISLSIIVRYRHCNKRNWWNMRTFLYYISLFALVLIGTAIAFTQNRSAWCAAAISCLFVVYTKLNKARRIHGVRNSCRKLRPAGLIISILLIIATFTGVYMIKNPTLKKQVWVWQVTSSAIHLSPVLGTGIGTFPVVFEQHRKTIPPPNKAFLSEKPLYAGSEYLQLALEYGMVGFVLLLVILIICIYKGIRNRQFGAAGALMSMAVLSVTSSPLQLPSFLILLYFLLPICLVNRNPIQTRQGKYEYMYAWLHENNQVRNILLILFTLLINISIYFIFISKPIRGFHNPALPPPSTLWKP